MVNPRGLIGFHTHEIKHIGYALKSHPPVTEPLRYADFARIFWGLEPGRQIASHFDHRVVRWVQQIDGQPAEIRQQIGTFKQEQIRQVAGGHGVAQRLSMMVQSSEDG